MFADRLGCESWVLMGSCVGSVVSCPLASDVLWGR